MCCSGWATALRRADDVDGAIAIWRQAIASHPAVADVHLKLGIALSKLTASRRQWPPTDWLWKSIRA